MLLAQAPSWSLSAAVEPRRESLTYHFDNPSAFDTAAPVPHFFEQTYDTGNIWIAARLEHRFFGGRGAFEAGATPSASRRADDFDTFFQSDGNVIVTGTTGRAAIRSWRVEERIEMGTARAARYGLAYAYRRDRAEFGVGDGITTTTRPPSTSRRVVTTRETTVSQLHAVMLFVTGSKRAGSRGAIDAVVDAAPVALARLTVDLPDKAPQGIPTFNAKAAMLGGRAAYRYAWTAWSLAAGVGAGRTFSFNARARMDRRDAFGFVSLTRRRP